MAIFHFYPIQGIFLLPLTLRDHVPLVVHLFMYEIIIVYVIYSLIIWLYEIEDSFCEDKYDII